MVELPRERKAEAMAYLPAPSPVPEPAPEVLLDAIDDELESIAHDGAGIVAALKGGAEAGA
ncbi:hypothetical protein AB0M68_39355 [Streptomyces sp. NPDC051453]|uniref:hypothetical protein n=1 Tax=Streptomyces sp. NPDC051453 TaxID=3154941 RepID=UPI003426A65C